MKERKMRRSLIVCSLYLLIFAIPSTALALRSEAPSAPAGGPANYVDGAVVAACSSTSGYRFPSRWRTVDDSAVTEIAKSLRCGGTTLYAITSSGRFTDLSTDPGEVGGGMVVIEISGLCCLLAAVCGLLGFGAVLRRRRTHTHTPHAVAG